MQVQEILNKESKIRIRAVKPELNQDRINGIVNKISEYDDFKKGKWLLKEPVINFTQAVVDDTIKVNADFQYKAGLRPEIIRKEFGNCCDWCKDVVGVYNYPEVPEDVYKRHRYCRCTVEYLPGNGKKRDIWSKKWIDVEKDDKIRRRKRIAFSESTKTAEKFPKELAGVKRGDMMSFDDADGTKPNPNFSQDYTYRINCQTCVVAYEARRRGYDVEALGNFEGSLSEMLSRATNKAWIDPDTGTFPDYIKLGYDSTINTPTKYYKYLKETLKDETRYTMEFVWKGRGNSGHIVNIFKEGENIKIYDPQTGEIDEDVKEYLKSVRFKKTILGEKYTTAPRLLEVENYEFNLEVVNNILKKAGD
ncbi:MAG: toxin glutamine deamidase domain-containing protein [Clostridia bacterium]|nr:toxin glutamine deamidase domain-containing protein [Clostridia bacterium]